MLAEIRALSNPVPSSVAATSLTPVKNSKRSTESAIAAHERGKRISVQELLNHFGSATLTVSPEDSLPRAAHKFSEEINGRKQSLAVVVDGNGVVRGVLSLGDLAYALGEHGATAAQMTVSQIMSQDVCEAKITDDLVDVMKRMAENQIRHLPVVNQGRLVGLVTRKDALEMLYRDAAFELKYLTEYVFRSGARY
jgi:CBS domain-containing protein